jgi:hypothetical protein
VECKSGKSGEWLGQGLSAFMTRFAGELAVHSKTNPDLFGFEKT